MKLFGIIWVKINEKSEKKWYFVLIFELFCIKINEKSGFFVLFLNYFILKINEKSGFLY